MTIGKHMEIMNPSPWHFPKYFSFRGYPSHFTISLHQDFVALGGCRHGLVWWDEAANQPKRTNKKRCFQHGKVNSRDGLRCPFRKSALSAW